MKQYSSTYASWWTFCQQRNLNPFHIATQPLLSFLQHILDSSSVNFGTINSHKAALSVLVDGSFSENVVITRFMKGVQRLRPPRARYPFVWDPAVVLDHLDSDITALPEMSKKLVILMALATGQRVQTLSLAKTTNVRFTAEGCSIFIPDTVKHSRVGSPQPVLTFQYFPERSNLCVATLLKAYLEKTKELRPSGCEKIFITFKKPHVAANKQTLSRWIKDVLVTSGVDTSIFSSHSTRHASSSAAHSAGVSWDVLRLSAGWSQRSSVFARFYKRPILEVPTLLNAVFKKQS
ncbi:Hypothetical protein NTJ_16244 [Nesidiocoris tenuis]|uniref:Tyr recombinase domain-containing protein n=1 Tax=Nesidiocoris tenuis TaxID=355587 RepID=A0ABN7BII8_9HEMI|nr:Hypothetical protein NTJ_16244 [Nesidiocoris tenuis]